jgi:hypothetical protein
MPCPAGERHNYDCPDLGLPPACRGSGAEGWRRNYGTYSKPKEPPHKLARHHHHIAVAARRLLSWKGSRRAYGDGYAVEQARPHSHRAAIDDFNGLALGR